MSQHRTPQFEFGLPPLDAEDERLVDAYESIGRTLDDLPYTDDFDRLCDMLGIPKTNEARHRLYKRLLALRKRGLLPRVRRPSSSSGP